MVTRKVVDIHRGISDLKLKNTFRINLAQRYEDLKGYFQAWSTHFYSQSTSDPLFLAWHSMSLVQSSFLEYYLR